MITTALILSAVAGFAVRGAVGQADEPLLLTPLIQAGDLARARAESEVKLPAEIISHSAPSGWAPPGSHSGFLTTKSGNNLFFWLWNADSAPSDSETVYWMQGGPGADDEFGLFAEMGPIVAVNDTDGVKRVLPRGDTWCPSHRRCLFIDNPVWAGFSFSSTSSPNGAIPDSVAASSAELVEVLEQLFTLFPQLSSGPFFVVGESYGGRYAPQLGSLLAKRLSSGASPAIPLRGVGVGDGWVDAPIHFGVYANALYGLGILDSKERDLLEERMREAGAALAKGDRVGAFRLWDAFFGDCGAACGQSVPSLFVNWTGSPDTLNFLRPNFPADLGFNGPILAMESVRRAIHVGNTSFGGNSGLIYAKWATQTGDFMTSSKPDMEAILASGCDLLTYNGNLDAILGAEHGYAIADALEWKGSGEWRNVDKLVWKDAAEEGSPVIGYVRQAGTPGPRTGGNTPNPTSTTPFFAQLTIRGAGHLVPHDQPRTARLMIETFLAGQRFQ